MMGTSTLRMIMTFFAIVWEAVFFFIPFGTLYINITYLQPKRREKKPSILWANFVWNGIVHRFKSDKCFIYFKFNGNERNLYEKFVIYLWYIRVFIYKFPIHKARTTYNAFSDSLWALHIDWEFLFGFDDWHTSQMNEYKFL